MIGICFAPSSARKRPLCRFETGEAMTPIDITQGPSTIGTDRRAPRESGVRAPVPEVGRALMPLPPTPHTEQAPPPYSRANFLAHLIATAQALPQTRERRRAEPNHAAAAYAQTAASEGPPARRTLLRVL
jgi:hypothetical protein